MSDITDQTLKSIMTDYVYGSDHPDLVVYRKDFGEKFDIDSWMSTLRNRCATSGFHNKRLLEVGCGFGWDAVGLSLVGGNEVVATDILPSMIDGVNECLAAAKAKGHNLKVTAQQADVCKDEFPDASFDGVFSSEAIEHVHNLDEMFVNCHRMLKSGGRLFLVNDSNQYNSEFREATFEMWKERDESVEHAEWLKAEIRPVEHANAKPYAVMRDEILREVAPALDDAARANLVKATAGMIRSEISTAAKTFAENGSLPTPPKFSWCRNPETGEYAERLLDPFELVAMLKRAGFRNVQLRHGFNRWPHRLLNGVSFRPLNEFLFDQRGLFYILADK